MAFLTFSIPTYNRAEKLKVCLTSIAKQIAAFEEPVAEVFVSDHGSTDHTAVAVEEVQSAFPSVHITYAVLPRASGHDFQHNFQFAFSAPVTPWTWTFGDDDLLMPGMLKAVADLIKQAEPEGVKFIKVGEVVRASPKPCIYRDLLIQLCGTWGFVEILGYITGNVVWTELLKKAVNLPTWFTHSKKAVNLPTWFTHSKNAFPHACALLEVLAPERALFLDMPVVDCQDHIPTEATIKQWERNQTAKRYFYVNEALADMVARKVIPPAYEPTFFRYHSYYLWDRLIGNMISQYSNHPDDAMPELWENIEGLGAFLRPEDSHTLLQRCRQVREAIEAHFAAVSLAAERSTYLNGLMEQHNIERFAFTYTGEPVTYEPDRSGPPLGTAGLAHVIWDAQKRQRRRDKEWLLEKDLALGTRLGNEPLADFPT